MRVLILGAGGMLGHMGFAMFSRDSRYETWGTLREESDRRFFGDADQSRLICGLNVLDQDSLIMVMNRIRPQAIINCVGVIKQRAAANDPLTVLPVNAMFPSRLLRLSALIGARLVHISTDCVFSGRKGGYRESDPSDADDLYGKSKYIGELRDDAGAVTLRTSIIGHELKSSDALVEWFLAQQGKVKGYAKAVFSGLPTGELIHVIGDFVLPHPELHGLYHVSTNPISKLKLLEKIAAVYGKDIEIVPDESVIVDRSLNSERFTRVTGYVAPGWQNLIESMHENRQKGNEATRDV